MYNTDNFVEVEVFNGGENAHFPNARRSWQKGYEKIDQSRKARLRRKHFDIRKAFLYLMEG